MKTLIQSALVAVLFVVAMTVGRSVQARQAPAVPAASSSDTQFVKVTTTMGDMVFELDRANAPKTVDNFLGYVGRGYYNGTTIHRVLKDHLLQGGGFLADTSAKAAGEPIVNESNATLKHTRETVAMARSTSGPNTATSQFFINVVDNANLDKDAPGTGHAIFAKVVVGMPIVDSIRLTPVGPDAFGESSRPITPIIIVSVRPISAEDVRTALATEARNAAASLTTSADASEVPAIVDIPKVAFVQFSTSKGDIVLQLDGEKAPISVANFLAYVDSGFYNGLIFHRVISGFMIQGGGFDTNMLQSKKTNPPIKNEYTNGLKNLKGTIAMAQLGGQPDSASSQFFINTVDNAALDQARDGAAYAVFGKVVAGMNVVDAIRAVPVGPNAQGEKSQPLSPITITSARRLTDAEAQKFVNQTPAGGH